MNIKEYKLGDFGLRRRDSSPQTPSRICEATQQDIALAVYGELPDDASHRLERHLEECSHCKQELEAVQGLRQAMSLYPMEEPSPNLLTRTRLRLEEALDAVPRSGWMTRIIDRLFNGIARVQSAPVMASALLVVGLGTGGFAGYRAGQKSAPANTPGTTVIADTLQDPPQIGDIRSIVRQPGNEIVAISYDRLAPETMTGSLDDPQIRQMVLAAAQSHVDTDVRHAAMGMLADECRAGHECEGGPVRDALMVALRRDKDPSVRLKALEGLQPYVGQDRMVRDVVLNALLRDSDPQVRIKAVDLLQPVDSDSSVRHALHSVADTDENPYLRTVSRQVLDRLPEVQ
jgi:hypothetical protein